MVVLAGFVAACARPELRPASPGGLAPEVRVGIVTGEGSLTLGGGGALTLAAPERGWAGAVPSGVTARVDVREGLLHLGTEPGESRAGPDLIVAGERSEVPVRVNGHDYRGAVFLRAAGNRMTVINRLDLEDYLVGVVGAELGIRPEAEFSALLAQAVTSRTLALQRIARSRRGQVYDLLASVSDQLYGGIGQETELAARAVRETRGQVLVHQGQVIDAFFHSTCAGRTAAGTEVFAAADRPYLRSIRDLDEGGRPWCVISPRYRWREVWTEERLIRSLRETLPAAGGSAALANAVRDLRVTQRTETGRVARLLVRGIRDSLIVSGPVARQILRPPQGGLLRSADFTLQITRNGERIVEVNADGAGAGHGVGMCQWGAIGRARAGLSYQAILAAYFPGTELSRWY
ncbi:MAG: SpoIID/LytB domain-containing protein [Gemmatimonadales bacterium]